MRPERVDVAQVRKVRAEVLRPGGGPEQVVWPGDAAPDTLHAAVFADGAPVGVASVMREGYPPQPGPRDWRIRGMATLPHQRGRGIGTALLELCLEHARDARAERVWCNARPGARSLYERAGLRVVGTEFDVPEIGPHVLMCLHLAQPCA
jgi:GNAT superfamily N-acetyltransferase